MAVVCLLQSGSMLMIYQFRQCYVQMEMGQALKDPNFHFQKLTLSLNDFQKYKINDHEVSIAGEMYDFKSVNITGNKVEFIAIRDTKEEGILKLIKKTIGFNKAKDQKFPNHLLVLLNMVYLTPGTCHSFFFQENNLQHCFCPIPSICSCPRQILSPPPEKV